MPQQKHYISNDKIKQIFILLVIVGLLCLMTANLMMFIPALLGAVTLYVVTRKLNFYLQDVRKWKPALAASAIIVLCIVVLFIPLYFVANILVSKISETDSYMPMVMDLVAQGKNYLNQNLNVKINSEDLVKRVTAYGAQASTGILAGTVNGFSVLMAMFFILYFMLEKPRQFEKVSAILVPLKRNNVNLVGTKFRKLVLANAVGVPVTALGQGLIALVGYLIFGAPAPILLFALTSLTSMLPIVGSMIVYLPVALFMYAQGDHFNAIGLFAYCAVVVGLTDNVLRFTVLKKLEDIHPLITVFGIIMGIPIFGFIGLIFGPILMSMTVLLIQIYSDEFSDPDEDVPPPLQIPDEPLEEKVKIIV